MFVHFFILFFLKQLDNKSMYISNKTFSSLKKNPNNIYTNTKRTYVFRHKGMFKFKYVFNSNIKTN